MAETHEAMMLRRAAAASENIRHQKTGDRAWFDWVPKYLYQLAEELDARDCEQVPNGGSG